MKMFTTNVQLNDIVDIVYDSVWSYREAFLSQNKAWPCQKTASIIKTELYNFLTIVLELKWITEIYVVVFNIALKTKYPYYLLFIITTFKKWLCVNQLVRQWVLVTFKIP